MRGWKKKKKKRERDIWKTCIRVKKNVKDKANKILNCKNLKEKIYIALQII